MHSKQVLAWVLATLFATLPYGCSTPSQKGERVSDQKPIVATPPETARPKEQGTDPATAAARGVRTQNVLDAFSVAYFFGTSGAYPFFMKDPTRGVFSETLHPPDYLTGRCWEKNCPSPFVFRMQVAATLLATLNGSAYGNVTAPPLPAERIKAANGWICNAIHIERGDLDDEGCDSLTDADTRKHELYALAASCGSSFFTANGFAIDQLARSTPAIPMEYLARAERMRSGITAGGDPSFCTRFPQKSVDAWSAKGLAAKLIASRAFLLPSSDPFWRTAEASVGLHGGLQTPSGFCDGCLNINVDLPWEGSWIGHNTGTNTNENPPSLVLTYGAYAYGVAALLRDRNGNDPPKDCINDLCSDDSVLAGPSHSFDAKQNVDRWTESSDELRPFFRNDGATPSPVQVCADAFQKRNRATFEALTARIASLELPLDRLVEWGPVEMLSSAALRDFFKSHPVRTLKPSDFDDPKTFAFCTAPTH